MWLFRREVKELIAYSLGAFGFLHELIIQDIERPFLLTASLTLMGFPLVFRGEERWKNGRKEKEE